MRVHSRPLQRAITKDIVLSLQTLKDLKNKVRASAEANERKLNRRGCTSDEMYEIFRSYFNTKIKEAIQHALEDLADQGSSSQLVNQSKQVLESAKDALLSYVEGVESLSKDTLKDKLKDLKAKYGSEFPLKGEEVDQLVSGSLDTVKGTVGSVGRRVWRKLFELRNRTMAAQTETKGCCEDGDPFFPDW